MGHGLLARWPGLFAGLRRLADRCGAALGCVLVLALAGRLMAGDALAVVFDEVCVMAYGIARALSGPPRALVFEVPVAVSNGITPLWFWLQAGPMALFGPTSKLGLRLVPSLLGLVSVALTFRLARSLYGPRAALVGGVLAAVGSPFLFANARGEYSESLLVPLVLLLYRDLRRVNRGAPPPSSAVWVALALLTYLGKGALVWAGFVLVLCLLWLVGRTTRRDRAVASSDTPEAAPLGFRLIALGVAPLLPTAAWLLLAQWILFSDGHPLTTDLGPVDDVWTNGLRLTIGYGSEAQRFMVAGWREALFVYRDFAAWPTLTLLAVPVLVALLVLCRDLAHGLRRADRAATAAAFTPLALVAAPISAILAKGALDVRFHLLYLPVLLVHAAGTIVAWGRLGEQAKPVRFFLWGLVGWSYVAWAMASPLAAGSSAPMLWASLGAGCFGAAVVLAAACLWAAEPAVAAFTRATAAAAVPAFLAFAVWSGLTLGPLDWGRRRAWEPSPIQSDAAVEVSDLPGPTLQLARCFLGRDDAEGARPYLVAAIEAPLVDRDTLLEAGRQLVDAGGPEGLWALRRMSDYLRRNPQDLAIRQVVEEATRSRAEPNR